MPYIIAVSFIVKLSGLSYLTYIHWSPCHQPASRPRRRVAGHPCLSYRASTKETDPRKISASFILYHHVSNNVIAVGGLLDATDLALTLVPPSLLLVNNPISFEFTEPWCGFLKLHKLAYCYLVDKKVPFSALTVRCCNCSIVTLVE